MFWFYYCYFKTQEDRWDDENITWPCIKTKCLKNYTCGKKGIGKLSPDDFNTHAPKHTHTTFYWQNTVKCILTPICRCSKFLWTIGGWGRLWRTKSPNDSCNIFHEHEVPALYFLKFSDHPLNKFIHIRPHGWCNYILEAIFYYF